MRKMRLLNEQVYELVSDPSVSDESIHIVHQFLKNLLEEFETQAFCRLRRYTKEMEELQNPPF